MEKETYESLVLKRAFIARMIQKYRDKNDKEMVTALTDDIRVLDRKIETDYPEKVINL